MKSPLGRLLLIRNPYLKEAWEKVNLTEIDEQHNVKVDSKLVKSGIFGLPITRLKSEI
jgi:hypothetical protein